MAISLKKNFLLFFALRERLREGYHLKDFQSDLMAGIVVGLVATPLGMALAIASGVAPQNGLYTVILAGGLTALLGGSRLQVTGPTAAFVVILAPIVERFGLGGLLTAGFLAGLMMILLGISRLGGFIRYIPYPVTTGFTSGIAVVIATLQLKDFFGLKTTLMPERFLEKVVVLARALPSFSFPEFGMGIFTLVILLLWPKLNKKIPAPLIALLAASIVAYFLRKVFPDLEFSTIGNRFTYQMNGVMHSGIPRSLPSLNLPWNFVGQDNKIFTFSLSSIQDLFPSAFAIMLLGSIESLLSAVIVDSMAQTKHNSDSELIALGVGNVVCPFFSGVAATGAIARTATNFRFGGTSPLSAVVHAFFVLLALLFLAPALSFLPMAALAALLILVAYNMSELKHFFHIIRLAPKEDVIVLLVCFSLTVLFDMMVGVSVGMLFAALLFMRRMAAVTTLNLRTKEPLEPFSPLWPVFPKDVVVYEISGPLFFGAAEKAVETLHAITDSIRTVVFVMDAVPMMDITGLVAFESALRRLTRTHREIVLVGVRKATKEVLDKSTEISRNKNIIFRASLDEVLNELVLKVPPES